MVFTVGPDPQSIVNPYEMIHSGLNTIHGGSPISSLQKGSRKVEEPLVHERPQEVTVLSCLTYMLLNPDSPFSRAYTPQNAFFFLLWYLQRL